MRSNWTAPSPTPRTATQTRSHLRLLPHLHLHRHLHRHYMQPQPKRGLIPEAQAASGARKTAATTTPTLLCARHPIETGMQSATDSTSSCLGGGRRAANTHEWK